MKTKVPDQLAAEVPQTKWGKTLLATPVIMTVIATLLAGLASSEMTRAQYDRALGAQLQSKAGDQWAYFQAKKLRGAMQQNSLALLNATAEIRTIENPALTKIPVPNTASMDSKVEAALEAIENQKTEAEITDRLVKERGFTVTKLPEAELARWHQRVAAVGDDWAKTMDSTNRPGTALLKALREVKAGN